MELTYRECIPIRARQLKRANPAGVSTGGHQPVCFNPRPPIKAGESQDRRQHAIGINVSIRARQLKRANRLVRRHGRRLHWFQSAPAN